MRRLHLQLEALEDRTLPSASAVTSLPVVSTASPPSPPPAAVVAPQLVSALDQSRRVYWNSFPKDSAGAWQARLLEAKVLISKGQSACALARLGSNRRRAL